MSRFGYTKDSPLSRLAALAQTARWPCPQADGQRLLREFLPRAMRRPVDDATLAYYVGFFQERLDKGNEFHTALRSTYKAIRLILIFAAVAMAPGLRAQDAKQQDTPAAGKQLAPFAALISKVDLDPAAFRQWVDGVEGSAPTWGDKPFDPVRLFWTREASQDYVGGWSFGSGTNLGLRHLRVGFHKAVPLGTILAAGNCSVSVLARYEVLKFQRARARDRFVLDDALMERILDECVEESRVRDQRLPMLERCLEKMPQSRRDLLLQAYSPGCTLRALAERLSKSEDALYQLLRRLRLELKLCVEVGLDEERGAT